MASCGSAASERERIDPVELKRAIDEGRVDLTRDETITADTTKTQILRQNANRVRALLINLSSNPGYVAWSGTPSSSRGMLLSQNGGGMTLEYLEDGEAVFKELYGVNTNSSGTWHIMEWSVRP